MIKGAENMAIDIVNRQALVVGMGKSGIAAAVFLTEQGSNVTICDSNSEESLAQQIAKLNTLPIKIFTGGYPGLIEEYDFVVVSPGVPLEIPPLKKATALGIPIIGELELVAMYLPQQIIAITGTNGKTTTTALTGAILDEGKHPVIVGGNIGTTVLEQIKDIKMDTRLVLEVSSFQLDITTSFRPKIAIILNITPDHLDRHGTFERYVYAKSKIFLNQEETDYLIINYDQKDLHLLADQAKSRVIFFSRQHSLEEGVFVSGQQIVSRFNGQEEIICSVDQVRIKGAHNLENSLAAIAAAVIMGIEKEHIANTLINFPGVAHRLEPVASIAGVEYVNDSKGTNPDATEKALAAFNQPIVLIVGGKDKGSSFTQLLEGNKEKIKALVVLGETKEKIISAAREVGISQLYPVESFTEAVLKASSLAQAGDVVLLSPACASWDMFNSYEERGDLFKKIVSQLGG